MKGDRPEAIADLDAAVRIAADETVPLVLRARIHQQAGDTERAAADLKRVLEKHPDHPAALELRGLIAAERNDYPAAIHDFRRLVSQKPDDAVLVGAGAGFLNDGDLVQVAAAAPAAAAQSRDSAK
jgi:predicted Zn-dependent protease